MKSLGQGMLKKLRKLCLSMITCETIGLEDVKPEHLPQLEHLSLQRCIASNKALEQLSHLVTNWTLYTLDISHSRGFKGELSILLQHEFPSLKSLILHDCALNEKDLNAIDLANAQGRLPLLEDLDLSKNCRLVENVGTMSSKWIHLKRLKLDNQPSPHILQTSLDILGKLTITNCFHSLQEIRLAINSKRLSDNETLIRGQFEYLKRLDIVPSTGHDIFGVCQTIGVFKEVGNFPALETVCILTDNVTRDSVSQEVNTLHVRFRNVGLKFYFINPDLEKLAIDSF